MRIELTRENFLALDAKYGEHDDDAPLRALAPAVKTRRELGSSDLEAVCRWKSARALPLIRKNTDVEVREVTKWSLSTSHERLRIESLLLLHGVSWPMASVILHWFHPDPYPVLDVRALWSLGIPAPSDYSFDFWWRYVSACREIATRLSLTMRVVDRALWQYSSSSDAPGTPA